jgi:hypothetical protein
MVNSSHFNYLEKKVTRLSNSLELDLLLLNRRILLFYKKPKKSTISKLIIIITRIYL